MEKPENSMDLFDFSQKFGPLAEHHAKIIFKQVSNLKNVKDMSYNNFWDSQEN